MYSTLVERSPDAIVLHYNDQFLYANPAAVNLFGAKDKDDLLSRSLMEFIPTDNQETVANIVYQLQNKDMAEVQPLSMQLIRVNGSRVDVEITANAVVKDRKRIVQGMIRDVTHQKLMREIQYAQREWKVIRMLVGNLADKTLNPLAVIDGFLTLLKQQDKNSIVDLLLREANSIQCIWEKLIACTHDQPENVERTLKGIFLDETPDKQE